MLQDSGARRQFESGAVRDISDDKGRCDLLPLDMVSYFLDAPELVCIEEFKTYKQISKLSDAIEMFAIRLHESDDTLFDQEMHNSSIRGYICTLLLDVSFHFKDGAVKYGENNWKKGIPLHCYLDSAVRHFLKYARGDRDEPHDRAFVWNLLCAMWTYTHKPELDDVEIDIRKEDEPIAVDLDDMRSSH